MPTVPIAWGIILVSFVPLLPPELVEYASQQESTHREWMFYLAYGACVGQFSSYLHDRLSGLLQMKNPPPADEWKLTAKPEEEPKQEELKPNP